MSLSADSFGAYFTAIHGCEPFPWQARLLGTVLKSGWPPTLSLPTASGKTAIMDVAVFALACQAHLPSARRCAPRRIALVVDRRIVVDDAFVRAGRIRDALRDPQDPTVRAVAEALASLGGETPLDVALLRGGIYREDRWARTPAQPVIMCSTVDQVGSRLLHRGYGLSSSMWPIHAGLLGNDCLIVLDEAHCSQPFLQTLAWIEKLRAVAKTSVLSPFKVVAMTATPRGQHAPFMLEKADYENTTLAMRLTARKLAKFATTGKKDEDFIRSCVDHVREFAKAGSTTLVVVNRVATGRAIRQQLEKLRTAKGDKKLDADSILLTGRCRSLERDALLAKWRCRLMAGRDRVAAKDARPLVVVATQCVEVGADLDADGLVTECCSFDALRQRLGRLDRLGILRESHAVILCREDQVGEKDRPVDDAIYGEALSRTWQWLLRKGGSAETVDLGIAALDGTPYAPGILPHDASARAAELAPLSAPSVDAPVVFPAYCDLWVQTGPEPGGSPDPAIFLHGPQRGEPDVRLVWRADLDPAKPDTWADTVSLCPPVSAESMPLPLSQARRWLAGETKPVDTGDLESAPTDPDEIESSGIKLALRWQGPERSGIARAPTDVRPGDVLILPCSYGGCDAEGWNPDFSGTVADLADTARVAARRQAVLRLHPALATPESWGGALPELQPLAGFSQDELPDDLLDAVCAGLTVANQRQAGIPDPLRQLLPLLLRAKSRLRVTPHPSGTGLVLSCEFRPTGDHADFSDEDDTSARASGAVKLFDHLADVEREVLDLAANAGLPPELAGDLALAARLHDLGKADPRFQALLAGGDRLRARRQGLLAKSARVPVNRTALAMARQRAGYPDGGRHELLSARLAESAPTLLAQSHDRDLVLHLVASHHGHCRPFAPVVFDDRPQTVAVDLDGQTLTASSATGLERLDSGVPERFWSLVRRYGWWGLSYLEACVRLADHRASESPTMEEQP